MQVVVSLTRSVPDRPPGCFHHYFQVHLQTQQEVRVRMIGMAVNVVRREGYLALYSGLSASLCRQVEI